MGLCELRLDVEPGGPRDWREVLGHMENARVDMQVDACARWEEER